MTKEDSVNATADDADGTVIADRLGFKPDTVVQELGWDEDVDDALREAVERHTGHELVYDDYGDVVDAVLLWWREGDEDLVDSLVDSLTDLAEGGPIFLLTPKVGRPGYVEGSDIAEAAPVAGLQTTTTQPAGEDWSGIRLVTPKSTPGSRR